MLQRKNCTFKGDICAGLLFVDAGIPRILATNANIEASRDVFPNYSGQMVVRVGKDFVARYFIDINVLNSDLLHLFAHC